MKCAGYLLGFEIPSRHPLAIDAIDRIMPGHCHVRKWRRAGLVAHVKLLAEVVADLDDQRDAFGIAGFYDHRRVGHGTELPLWQASVERMT